MTGEGRNSGRPVPLASGALFRSRDPADLADRLAESYGARDVKVDAADNPVLGVANRIRLDGVTLHYCRYDAPVSIDFQDMPGFRQVVCLSGSGRIAVGGRALDIDPAHTGIVPPTSTFRARYGKRYQHLVIQFDEDALSRQAALLDHGAPDLMAALPIFDRLALGQKRRARDIALALAGQFGQQVPSDAPSLTHLASALRSAFVEEFFPGPNVEIAPASQALARRLRDYIHANWRASLTVESIAAATGASVRSVFAAFSRDFNETPASYIRNVRLDEVHRQLAHDPHASVMEAALACGFSSLGHFARRYHERFGELPSTTLARRQVPIDE